MTDFFGKPSSSHLFSQEPRRALAEARAQVAGLIGAGPSEIVATGSAVSQIAPSAGSPVTTASTPFPLLTPGAWPGPRARRAATVPGRLTTPGDIETAAAALTKAAAAQ